MDSAAFKALSLTNCERLIPLSFAADRRVVLSNSVVKKFICLIRLFFLMDIYISTLLNMDFPIDKYQSQPPLA